MRASTAPAAWLRPLLTSHRGLSGTNHAEKKNKSDGAATRVNIQRQPYCPFQDCAIVSDVAPSGTFCATTIFSNCAARMPNTMVNWFKVTRRPRNSAGATSAIYNGERLEAIPIAVPPSIRHPMNSLKRPAQPVSTEEMAKRKAEKISSFLRPNLSLTAPASRDPARQPSKAQLLAHPLSAASEVKPTRRARPFWLHCAAIAGRSKYGSKKG